MRHFRGISKPNTISGKELLNKRNSTQFATKTKTCSLEMEDKERTSISHVVSRTDKHGLTLKIGWQMELGRPSQTEKWRQ